MKPFDSEMIFFGLDWGKVISVGQKHFRETNNSLCKISTAETTLKRNDCLREILFPVTKPLHQVFVSQFLSNHRFIAMFGVRSVKKTPLFKNLFLTLAFLKICLVN